MGIRKVYDKFLKFMELNDVEVATENVTIKEETNKVVESVTNDSIHTIASDNKHNNVHNSSSGLGVLEKSTLDSVDNYLKMAVIIDSYEYLESVDMLEQSFNSNTIELLKVTDNYNKFYLEEELLIGYKVLKDSILIINIWDINIQEGFTFTTINTGASSLDLVLLLLSNILNCDGKRENTLDIAKEDFLGIRELIAQRSDLVLNAETLYNVGYTIQPFYCNSRLSKLWTYRFSEVKPYIPVEYNNAYYQIVGYTLILIFRGKEGMTYFISLDFDEAENLSSYLFIERYKNTSIKTNIKFEEGSSYLYSLALSLVTAICQGLDNSITESNKSFYTQREQLVLDREINLLLGMLHRTYGTIDNCHVTLD